MTPSPMDALTYATFTAVLALFALGIAAVAGVVRLAAGPRLRADLADSSRWLAWLVALVATVGSLVYSEVYLFEPCLLCWYQRIAMYPLAVVLGVGAIRRDRAVRLYGLPLAVTGLGISIYHYLLQVFPALEGGACDPANPCSVKEVDIFGFISIPFMAGAGFLLIAVLLASFSAEPRSKEPIS